MTKTQKIVFENKQDPAQNVTMHLVLEKQMKILPAFYQVLHWDNKIFLSEKKWDEWKRLPQVSAQLTWLHKNVRIYEPGHTHIDVDLLMPGIIRECMPEVAKT